MSYAVNIHSHTPKRTEKQSPLEMWTSAKSTHTHLTNSCVWGCTTYVLDPRLQDGFKIPRWEPRSRRGIFLGFSPLHASTVGLILNPKTQQMSPQFHCVYDENFETVHNDSSNPPDIWEELVINSRFRSDIGDDATVEDNWDLDVPGTSFLPTPEPKPGSNDPQLNTGVETSFRDGASSSDRIVELDPFMANPFLEDEPEPTTITPLPHVAKPVTEDVQEDSPTASAQPRRSSRAVKPVYRIVMSKASG